MSKPPAINPEHPLHVSCSVLEDGTTILTQLHRRGNEFTTVIYAISDLFTGDRVKRTADRDKALLNHDIMRGRYERETGQEQ